MDEREESRLHRLKKKRVEMIYHLISLPNIETQALSLSSRCVCVEINFFESLFFA